MRLSNSTYDTENSRVSSPRFLINFDGLTNDYASGDFLGRNTSTQLLFMGFPKMSTQEIDPLSPDLQFIGKFQVPIQDNGNEITALIANNSILGRKVTLKSGFKDIAESNFINFFVGRVIDYGLDASMEAYIFTVEGTLPDLNKSAFTGLSETQVDGQISSIHWDTTLAANASSGSDIRVQLTRLPAGIEEDDTVFFDDGAGTNETTIIKEVDWNDASGNPVVVVDLSNTYSSGDTFSTHRIPVDDVTDFLNSVPVDPPFSDGLAILIGNEIIKYDSKASNRFILNSTSRTLFNSIRQRHSDDQKVKECWIIRDDPITLLLNVLTTTSGGTNGSFDLGVANFGLGFDESLLDQNSFTAIRDEYFSGTEFRFLLSEPMNGVDFAKQIALMCGFYYTLNQDGQLTANKVQRLNSTLSEDTLTDDDWNPDNVRWTPGINRVVNEVEYRYNFIPGRNDFLTTRTFELSESKTAFNITKRIVFEMKGNIVTGGTAVISDYLKVIADRYANPPPRLDFQLRWEKHLLEAGDIISITSSHIPNIKDGNRSLSNEIAELVKAEPDIENGVINASAYMYSQENSVAVSTSDEGTITDGTANLNATDTDTVQGDDATWDNSADINISGTRVIVTVKHTLSGTEDTGPQSIDYTIRIGDQVDTATMTVTTESSFTQTWIGEHQDADDILTFTHTFDGLADSVYDVKLDFTATGGSEPGNTMTLAGVTIESDGATYSEIT